jgi:hypothetical protein
VQSEFTLNTLTILGQTSGILAKVKSEIGMNALKMTIGYVLSAQAAALAVFGGMAIAGYVALMVTWFHVPALLVLSLSVPVLLCALGLARACNKAGKALRRSSYSCQCL